MPRDFKKAREKSRNAADDAVGDKLDKINEQADKLRGVFDALKLTDQATYDGLIEIVESATAKNESIASVIDRVKALGEAGVELAGTIGNLSSGGALAVLSRALNLPATSE